MTANNKTVVTKKKVYKDDDWRKIVAVVLVIVVGFFVLIFSVIFSALNAPKLVSDELIRDIQGKNAVAAYSLFSDDSQKALPKAKFEAAVNQIGPILNGQPKKTGGSISVETGKPSSASISYEIKGSDGLTYNVTVKLEKQNGVWKVTDFNSVKQ